MKRSEHILLVRHGDEPADDRAVLTLRDLGYATQIVRPFRGEALPDPARGFAGVVIYGGPFNAFAEAEHPFLREERRLIERSMAEGVPLLGICQGAQQIAHHLGAHVGPHEHGLHEFGLYEIRPTDHAGEFLEAPMYVSQAHFHGFDLPAGAERLAYSDGFANQAVRFNETTYGFQFHPEVTRVGFERWQNASWALYGKPGAQTRREQDRLWEQFGEDQATWFRRFLEGFVSGKVAARRVDVADEVGV